jgi:hypothetical protein
MNPNLKIFEECIRKAPTSKWDDSVVRNMVQGMAKTCPIDTLVRLGQVLVDMRKAELRDSAERN